MLEGKSGQRWYLVFVKDTGSAHKYVASNDSCN